ncbi:MAG: HlyD family efflux transporter periplasmic adaptor subunit [Planctomycetota bacterium]
MKRPSPKMIALAFRVFLGLACLMVGGAVYQALENTAKQLETTDPADRTLHVQVMPAQRVEIARQWSGYGETMPKHNADVPARVGTTVLTIPEDIEVGYAVTQGQILAQLDSTNFQQDLDAATAQLAEVDASLAQLEVDTARLNEQLAIEQEEVRIAQDEYDRQLGYLESDRAVQQDVDRAHRALLAAKRQVLATNQAIDGLAPRRSALDAQRQGLAARQATAQSNVDRCTITSPMDGIIEALDIEEGENLMAGARVARIVDPRVIEIALQLPASARYDVEKNNRVQVTTRHLPPDCPPWQATIERLGSSNDTATRTFTAYALLEQPDTALSQIASGGGVQRLALGAFVMASVTTNDIQPRWVVPARAIRDGRVRLVAENTLTSRAVTVLFEHEGPLPQLGLPDTQWVVLSTPLEPGELVVVNASVSILDGQRVEPVVMPLDGETADDNEAAAREAAPDTTSAEARP